MGDDVVLNNGAAILGTTRPPHLPTHQSAITIASNDVASSSDRSHGVPRAVTETRQVNTEVFVYTILGDWCKGSNDALGWVVVPLDPYRPDNDARSERSDHKWTAQCSSVHTWQQHVSPHVSRVTTYDLNSLRCSICKHTCIHFNVLRRPNYVAFSQCDYTDVSGLCVCVCLLVKEG